MRFFVTFHLITLLSVIVPPAAASAAETVVERRIAALQPCAQLRQEVGDGLLRTTLAIDKLRRVSLSQADAALRGSKVSLSFTGGLTCATSDKAVVRGDAALDLVAEASVDLAGCRIEALTITPTRFGGRFGAVLQALWQAALGPRVEAEARKMVREACAEFTAQ